MKKNVNRPGRQKSRGQKRKGRKAGKGFFPLAMLCLIALLAAGALCYRRSSPAGRAAFQSALCSEIEEIGQLFSSPASAGAAAGGTGTAEAAVGGDVAAPNLAGSLISLPRGLELPHCAAQAYGSDHEIRHFTDYSLCYRESYELAEWSAYCLEKGELEKNAGRSNDFRPDPLISTGSAELSDYRKSGYDRGHLAPAADFAYSAQAMSETFFMSNMTPQTPAFNRGIWQHLEAQVRLWAQKYGRVYVVTGPVLSSPAEALPAIGDNAVAVPRWFYKVLLLPLYADEEDEASPDDCADLACFAYIIPNEDCQGDFYDYAVTVDEVEGRTGIDFFWQLEDGLEARIESKLW